MYLDIDLVSGSLNGAEPAYVSAQGKLLAPPAIIKNIIYDC